MLSRASDVFLEYLSHATDRIEEKKDTSISPGDYTLLSFFSDVELRLFRLLTALPAGLEIWDVFLEWAGFGKLLLNHLLDIGIIQYRETYYIIHEFIRDILRFDIEAHHYQIIDFKDYGKLLPRLSETDSYICEGLDDYELDKRMSFPRAICYYIIQHNVFNAEIGILLVRIAKVLEKLNDLENTIGFYRYYIENCENVYGHYHYNTLIGYLGLARVFSLSSEYGQALEYTTYVGDKIQKLQEETLSKYQYSELAYEIGCLYTIMNNYENSIIWLNESLQELNAYFHDDEKIRKQRAKLFYAFAEAYGMKGNIRQALEYYNKSNSISNRAANYNAIALCYHEIKKYENAFYSYLKAYKITSEKYGTSHIATTIVKNNLCCLVNTSKGLFPLRFTNIVLESFDFSGCYLVGADFRSSRVYKSNFWGSNLSQANFRSCDLEETDFTGANLESTDLSNAIINNSILKDCILLKAMLNSVNVVMANLSFSNLRGAILDGSNLRDADLRMVDLSKAKLIGTDFSIVDLSEANLSKADLSKANLSEANLCEVDLSGANLTGVNLSEVNLNGANLSGANLTGANLSEVNLNGANLSGANLTSASFSGVNLNEANLTGANLTSASLSEVNLNEANLTGANLTGVTS